jgi:hypothetical protein
VSNTKHEWKIGDWAAGGTSKRWLIVSCEPNRMNLMGVSNEDGFQPSALDPCYLEPLPDCTGWQWKPKKPTEASRESESVVLAMRMAAESFGGDDGVFNGAGFSQAMRQLSGVTCTLDGYVVATILDGRSDVEVLKGGSHYRMIGYKATTLNAGSQQAETPTIEPPDGYRLLEEGEKIHHDDLYWDVMLCWKPLCTPSTASLCKYSEAYWQPIARKVAPYRPFASEAEFRPHRERWARWKSDHNVRLRIDSYCDTGIWQSPDYVPYKYAFEKLEFEDGTPFGVEVGKVAGQQ